MPVSFKKRFNSIGVLLLLSISYCNAQNHNILGQQIASNINLPYAAPLFLLIPPDAHSAGLGDAGVASEPDINSVYWNPAKLAFVKDTFGFSVSYTPWLRQLVPDINFSDISAFFKISNHQTIGASLRYFSYENIQFNNNNGVIIGNYNPKEYAIDLCYSGKLSDNWSAGFTGRYIYSNLNGSSTVQGQYSHAGKDISVDVSAYHTHDEINILGMPSMASEGVCISNMGPQINYNNPGDASFLPTNLRIGAAQAINLNKENKVTIMEDANKLLVPTPPVYAQTSTGINNNPVILAGMNPNVTPVQGMIQSFYDAPGGASEQWHEITWSFGMEYNYNNQFAARAGYFYENPTKGGREFYTLGVGFTLTSLHIDAAYLLSVSQQNPLQNTLYISLSFTFPQKKYSGNSVKTS